MRLVAVDTSTWWGGVALLEERGGPRDPEVVTEAGLLVRDSHATHLLRLLEHLLEEAGWGRGDVDAWAATRGPGSFTGLRVGLGTVRGLALASRRPALGIGTLEAMAEAFGPSTVERVPLLDAGRGEVFGARYDPEASPPAERVAPWLGPPTRVLEDCPGAVDVFGPGAAAHAQALSASAPVRLRPSPRGVAAGAGRLACLRLRAGAGDGEGLSPLYLRPPDAVLAAGAPRED
jgi:tRNA threonylcarbamoyladenosine biosynthesis protein TsaB